MAGKVKFQEYSRGRVYRLNIKNLEKLTMIRNKYAAFILFIIAFLAMWNLLDYLYSTFITGSSYQFAAGSDMGLPVVAAVVVGYILFLRKKSD